MVNAVKPPSVRNVAQAELDPGGVAQRLVPVAAGQQLGGDVVGVGVLRDQRVDLGVGDRVDDRRPGR